MPSSSDAGSAAGFAALGLNDVLVAAVAALGYEEPTPVQRQTIPLMLAGGDLLAQAATGTGKTAAFALPLIHRLGDDVEPGAAKKRGRARTRGVVLVPTRELAMQVAEAMHKYAPRQRTHRRAGVRRRADDAADPRPRARRRHRRRHARARARSPAARSRSRSTRVAVLVLDEADEMLDMGFAEDLDAILEATPKTRQTALFSATMPPRLRSIAQRHLEKPQRIQVAREKVAAGRIPRVRQVVYFVPRAHKTAALQRVLDMESPASALVFCRTRLEVDTLVETLNAHGYRAEAIHGGMQQRQREAVMARFRSAKADLLDRDRRRGPRAGHPAALSRLQLRRAVGARRLHPSHRPHRPRRTRWRGDHAGRLAREPADQEHRGGDQAEDRSGDRADGRGPACEAGRADPGRGARTD